ncbi:hypothetical protein IG631_19122 [Alternaria alternata]|nr:hypothetical protein IG631_19122 [Alternaria alternata]
MFVFQMRRWRQGTKHLQSSSSDDRQSRSLGRLADSSGLHAKSALGGSTALLSPTFELVIVPDIAREGAFDEAVRGRRHTLLCNSSLRMTLGVSAVVHVATILTFDPNPDNVIPGVVTAAIGAMKAATKEPTVKRFIFTSSSAAVVSPFACKDAVLDEHTWNERAVEEAYKPPTNDPYRA